MNVIAEGAEEKIMTDFQFRAIIELVKSVVRELHDEEKIIERLEQIKRGESAESTQERKK